MRLRIINRLRNKCAMTCVKNMNQNNFSDKVYSLLAIYTYFNDKDFSLFTQKTYTNSAALSELLTKGPIWWFLIPTLLANSFSLLYSSGV